MISCHAARACEVCYSCFIANLPCYERSYEYLLVWDAQVHPISDAMMIDSNIGYHLVLIICIGYPYQCINECHSITFEGLTATFKALTNVSFDTDFLFCYCYVSTYLLVIMYIMQALIF